MDKSATQLFGALSYWRASAGEAPTFPRPDLSKHFDIVVIGGGFHGLWTAYHLLKQAPSLSVALLEQHQIGFGASGRNGGFAATKLGTRIADVERKYGAAATRQALDLLGDKLHELVGVVSEEAIDCELDYGGLLIVAANKSQERRIMKEYAAAERIGLQAVQLLSGSELRSRVNSPSYLSGYYEPRAAMIHPLKLARGLASITSRMGLQISENTKFRDIKVASKGVEIETSIGTVRGSKAIMTLNAWAANDRRFSRSLVPVYAYILMTEPLSDAHWRDIGWAGREGIEDGRINIHFYRRTRDGRILWGGSDNKVPFMGRIHKSMDADQACFERLRRTFVETFPTLQGVRFDYSWGGPFSVTPDFLPNYGVTKDGKLIFGHGCCGHGVALSYFGGQIMRDLALEQPTEADDLCFMKREHPSFPIEPFRSIGGSLTLKEARWYDDAQASGKGIGREPLLLRLAPKWFS